MNGAIIVNKEKGFTSRDVINRLNKILHTKKIGHIGTLDPMATGVLVCLVGKCTKLCNVLVNHDKEYIASFKLGLLTDTLDITGQILKEENYAIDESKLKEVLNSFVKTYKQTVPLYSAVKKDGKKLYEYARNNIEVTLPERMCTIYSLELLNITNDIITIKTKVSKGTYIRALIRDIGDSLNTYGTMTSLERISLDKFTINDSYTLEEIEKGNFKMLKPEEILNCKIVNTNEKLLFKIQNGQRLEMNDEYVLFKYLDKDIAIYQKFKDNEIKPLIIF